MTALRRFRPGRAAATACWALLGGFDNRANWHIGSNGEAGLLRRLAAFEPTVVFDVGANTGEWSRHAAARCTAATIHAFEPVPETAAQLTALLGTAGASVDVHVVALGNENRSHRLSTDVARSSLVSLLGHADPSDPTSIEVGVITGDSFCDEHGIDHIDLLKIDAEGTDHLVIEGFHRMLTEGRIDVIQFEYGVWALETKFLLHDFYTQLTSLGFAVGKLFPRGVEFSDYTTRWEDFRGLNFVAVDRRRPDLIAALSEQ